MVVGVEHGMPNAGRPPLLHGQTDPRSLFSVIRRLQERIDALERFAGGFIRPEREKTLNIGSPDLPATVVSVGADGVAVAGGAGGGPADPAFTGPNQVPYSDGSSAPQYLTLAAQTLLVRLAAGIVGLTVGTNQAVVRAGGSIVGLGLGTDQALGRRSGNIQALTGDDLVAIADIFQATKTTFGAVTVVTGSSPTLNLNQDSHACVSVISWTGTATINLPTGSGVRVGKTFLICDTQRAGTGGAPISINPGTGNSIDNLGAGSALALNGGTGYTAGGWVTCVAKSGSVLTWSFMGQP